MEKNTSEDNEKKKQKKKKEDNYSETTNRNNNNENWNNWNKIGDNMVKKLNGYLLKKKIEHKHLLNVRSFSGSKIS